ncbi:hypothetical protein [Paenibacillus apiarius]
MGLDNIGSGWQVGDDIGSGWSPSVIGTGWQTSNIGSGWSPMSNNLAGRY